MRRKNDSVKWTLLLVLVFSQFVYSRPQVESTTLGVSVEVDKSTDNTPRISEQEVKQTEKPVDTTPSANIARDVKNKVPVIGDSIKKVATQLLDKPDKVANVSVVTDTRIPPKVKTQVSQKQKIKTRNEDEETFEYSHAGVAVPVTMEELELENKDVSNESSTSSEGISTWILLSNPVNKDSAPVSTEPTKAEEVQKKQKVPTKNKNKKPQTKVPAAKRPIIGSTNKADLIAGGSAINENVYNKIKNTVLSNVQKNKNTRTTTVSTTTLPSSTEVITTKAPVPVIPVIKVTSKPKKNNKNKLKTSTTTTTLAPNPSESALLAMEPKEQEIELEISTPATTTKKPKRKSTKKKTKTKKRKTTKPKTETAVSLTSDIKTANKTKANKNSKKPNTSTGPFTTQIYNYFSREVMPSVGVGVIGLAGLVGIASYFLYPFASPVRRTIEVDKKDDIYRHNGEEYASEGNGQPEEEMLGTVLAGMPVHSKQKFNPYAGQTAYINRYPAKKDQDIRYRQVANNNYDPNHSVHYPQQKTGIAHGAVYPEPINYNRYQYETRHAYTTEKKYEKTQSYTPYPAVEPIYAAPQTGPSGISTYGSDAANSVVYGVKPSDDTDFKPVYPYDPQFYSETTSSPVTYSPTSMYLGSNNEADESNNSNYSDDTIEDSGTVDNKFVVGNVPKELTESATPVVVPEHGPRKLSRKRRSSRRKRGIVGSIEEILRATRENKENEIFISNEVDDGLGGPITSSPVEKTNLKNEEDVTPESKDVFTVYAVTMNPTEKQPEDNNEVVESVSTLSVDQKTETDMSNEIDMTTKSFKVYEVFPTTRIEDDKSSSLINEDNAKEFTTFKNMNTETTTEGRSENTSTMPSLPSSVSILNKPRPTYDPEVITYPPLSSNGGVFDFLKRLVEFKYRLGLSILQTTSDSLSRYLRSLDDKMAA